MNAYLVWRPGTKKDGICKLKGLTGVPKSFQIDNGVSRLEGWPAEAAAAMNPDFPKDLGLADSLPGATFQVISGKAKQFIEKAAPGNIEFLPMKIINHKGRLASEDYFVVNPLEMVDCIDKDASSVEFNPINKDVISGCAQLVLKEEVIPPDLKIFRAKFWRGMILIGRDLAQKMAQAGLTGMRFVEPAEYKGLS
jgi:hypothetical protein